MRIRLTVLTTAIGTLGMSALPVLAHHGWGGNDEPITLSGTVTQPVSLSGPHATMQIEDEGGQVWNVTLAPAPRTSRAGLKDGMIPAGEEVTIEGERNADPSIYEVKTRRVTWNGENYDVYQAPRG